MREVRINWISGRTREDESVVERQRDREREKSGEQEEVRECESGRLIEAITGSDRGRESER